MRFPNGYGSIAKLSGKRRKPYWVRKAVTKWNEKGYPIYETIGYYSTKSEAITALSDYNKSPYMLKDAPTFSELYEKWSEKKYTEISPSAVRTYKSAYSYCTELYDLKMSEIKAAHLQNVIDTADVGCTTRARIKTLYNLMYEYAVINEIVSKDYSKYVKPPKVSVTEEKVPFTINEINTLWKHSDLIIVKAILINIYTGFRAGELVALRVPEGININEMYFKGGSKTEAGKDRVVPMHHDIIQLVKELTAEHDCLLYDGNGAMDYSKYYRCFIQTMNELGMQHKPHECRHTFATLLDNAGANKVAVKRLMGHASKNVTDKVYTHKDVEQLQKAVELLPGNPAQI